MHEDQFTDFENHRRMASLVPQLRGLDVTTVLLHGFDFLRKGVRQPYREAGFEIDCAGWPRDFAPPMAQYADVGDRVSYLPNLLSTFRQHEYLVTDGFGTHVLYAHTLGMKVLFLHTERSVVPGKSANLIDFETRLWNWTHQSFLELTPTQLAQCSPVSLPTANLDYWTAKLLGTDQKRSRSELHRLLRWREGVVPDDLSYNLF